MDLFEYQAKQLFQQYGVPVGLGEVATHAGRGAGAVAEQLGGVTVVKAQVKTGGRGKAGGVKVAKHAGGGRAAGRADPGHGHQGPHGAPRAGRSRGADRGGVLRLLPARPGQPQFLAMASYEGGMEIEQLAVERPEALAKVPVDAIAGVDAAKAQRDRRRPRSFPAEVADQVADVARQAVGGVRRRRTRPWSRSTRWRSSRDGSVVALDGKVTLDDNADFRHAGQRRLRRQRRRRPARGEGQGEEPQLRQARRRGRHHRQRRRSGHVDPGRRRVRRREARRGGEPGELPRHRRRRIGRGDGQRARTSSSTTRPCAACSSTSSAASPPATRSRTASSTALEHARATRRTSRSSSGSTATMSIEGRRILDRGRPSAGHAGRHDGRRGRQGRRARARAS